MVKGTWIGILIFYFSQLFSQNLKKETSYVSADFQSVLNLTISDPQVDFDFNSVEDYQNGLVVYNAVTLQVDATLGWDLFAYAATDHWQQIQSYSSDGEAELPAEILEVRSSVANRCAPAGGTFNSFTSLKGPTNAGVAGGVPDASRTQFLAGMVGKEPGQQYDPGSAKSNPETNLFKLHYRIVPGIRATFPNSSQPVGGAGFAQKGNYTLEVVFALVEDL